MNFILNLDILEFESFYTQLFGSLVVLVYTNWLASWSLLGVDVDVDVALQNIFRILHAMTCYFWTATKKVEKLKLKHIHTPRKAQKILGAE